MNACFLSLLRCPFCGGKLRTSKTDQSADREYNILRCNCDEYPVVGGIPILKKDVTGTTAEAVALIKSGQPFQALLTLVSPASPTLASPRIRALLGTGRGARVLKRLAHQRALGKWQEHAENLLTNRNGSVTACDVIDFYFGNEKVRNYFGFRFSAGRYLEGLSFASSLIRQPTKPILDLACGCGHNTWGLLQHAKAQPIIGLDNCFFSLYLAKRWIATEAQYVCCEADSSLPFPDGAFSAAFCCDAFQYFANKVTSIRELKRLTEDDGIIVLYWLRNALLNHPYQGFALSPEAYQALVADMPHRLIADNDVLERYLKKQGPALAQSEDMQRLATEPVATVVASYREEIFRDYGFFEDWPHAQGSLKLNPLYRRHEGDRSVILRRTFPSKFYEENSECKSYLPEVVTVGTGALSDMLDGKRTPEVERLIEQSVILSIPDRYGSLIDLNSRE